MNHTPLEEKDPSEEFFRALELRRTRALVDQDMQTLQELHAPDYELITPAGIVLNRKRYLEAVEREPFYSGWEAGEIAFRISAELTILRYQARLRFPSGKELHCWHTDAYQNQDGAWRAVWSQATEIKQALTHSNNGRAA